jgi:ribosomal protein L21E
MFVKGIFHRDFHGRKIIGIKANGESFTVCFSDGEILQNLSLTELNHVVVTATGR